MTSVWVLVPMVLWVIVDSFTYSAGRDSDEPQGTTVPRTARPETE